MCTRTGGSSAVTVETVCTRSIRVSKTLRTIGAPGTGAAATIVLASRFWVGPDARGSAGSTASNSRGEAVATTCSCGGRLSTGSTRSTEAGASIFGSGGLVTYGSNTLTDTAKTFTTNQLAGLSVSAGARHLPYHISREGLKVEER